MQVVIRVDMLLQPVIKLVHEELIDRCQKGDNKAFYEVYELYSRQMFSICRRMLNSREEAEDTLQDAFTAAFKGIHQYRKDSTFGAWLKRIVVNKCINYINKNKIVAFELKDEITEGTIDDSTDVHVNYSDLSINGIKHAVAQLPQGYKTVLNLYLFEGYDHKEIAEITGITESTSKSQYLRAKNKLKTILKDQGYER